MLLKNTYRQTFVSFSIGLLEIDFPKNSILTITFFHQCFSKCFLSFSNYAFEEYATTIVIFSSVLFEISFPKGNILIKTLFSSVLLKKFTSSFEIWFSLIFSFGSHCFLDISSSGDTTRCFFTSNFSKIQYDMKNLYINSNIRKQYFSDVTKRILLRNYCVLNFRSSP